MSLFGLDHIGMSLDSAAKVIQMALTPVFLLTGLANLMNVFSTRLARVATRVDQALKALEAADPASAKTLRDQLAHLRRRSLALDTAVILAATAGASTCATVLMLFLGSFGDGSLEPVPLVIFAFAVCTALAAIAAYATEMLMAGTGIRAELADDSRRRFLRHHHDT